jgi:hypothetical protein
MLTRTISLLTLSVLLSLPTGIASANEMNLQTDNVRLTIGKDGGIKIRSNSAGTVVPNSVRTVRVRKNPNRVYRAKCSGYNRTITQRNSSGTAVNRTYSSVTTCR